MPAWSVAVDVERRGPAHSLNRGRTTGLSVAAAGVCVWAALRPSHGLVPQNRAALNDSRFAQVRSFSMERRTSMAPRDAVALGAATGEDLLQAREAHGHAQQFRPCSTSIWTCKPAEHLPWSGPSGAGKIDAGALHRRSGTTRFRRSLCWTASQNHARGATPADSTDLSGPWRQPESSLYGGGGDGRTPGFAPK